MDPTPPLTLGPYRLDAPVGRGGMSEVWRAVPVEGVAAETGGQPVAVKVLTATRATDRRVLGSFREEVRAVARLDHPGIIRIHDHGEVTPAEARGSDGRLAPGAPWLAMELVPGGTLGSAPPATWAELRRVLLALLDALAHAHARGLVHRDIKPANILRAADGLRLSDFGAVQDRDWLAARLSRGDAPDTVFGTVAYMPPEQVRGQWRDQGPWTDLYALAALSWRLSTGAAPFAGEVREVLRQHCLVPPPAYRPRFPVPEGFEAWLRTLLDKEPGLRFQRAADAAWALVQLGPAVEGSATAPAFEALPTWASASGTLPPPPTETTFVAPPSSAVTISTAGSPPPLPTDWRPSHRPDATAPPPAPAAVGLGLFGLRTVPLAGREAERDALWQAFAGAAEAGRPGAVVVTGQAGHGKSRLAEAVATRLDEVGAATVLRVRHGRTGGPGEGLRAGLLRHLGAVGLRGKALRQHLARTLHGAPVGMPEALAALLDETEATASARPQPPGARRAVLLRSLAFLAEPRPLVLLLDDLHLGPEAAELTAVALDRWPDTGPRILFLGTARPPEEAPLPLLDRADVQHLSLAPLDPAAARALVAGLLPLSPKLAERVVARADGNPLFAVQLVGDWVERRALEPCPDGWDLRREAAALADDLPDDIHALWTRRLDRLFMHAGPDDRPALELAALLGRTFSPREWIAACSQLGLLPSRDLLDQLVGAGLAERRSLGRHSAGGHSEVTLSHALLAESLERAAAEAGRSRRLHAACARALADAADQPGVRAERLARHALAGGEEDLAIAALFSAAQHRLRDGDAVGVARYLDPRDALLDAREAPEDHPERLRAGGLRVETEHFHGDARSAAIHGMRLLSLARRAADPAVTVSCLTSVGNALRGLGEVDRARALLEEAAVLVEEADLEHTALSTAATAWRLLADMRVTGGDVEGAWTASQRALALNERLGDRQFLAASRALVGRVALVRGDLSQAEANALAAQQLLRQGGGPFHEANAWNLLGEVRRARADLSGAAEAYAAAARCFQLAYSSGDTVTRLNLAMVEVLRGRMAAARTAAEEVLADLGPGGRQIIATYARTVRLVPLCRQGEWTEATADLDRVAPFLAEHALVDPDMATCLLRAGEAASEHPGPQAAAVARRGLTLALGQLEALGRTEEAARVRKVLGEG